MNQKGMTLGDILIVIVVIGIMTMLVITVAGKQ